ncbi:unnamed protein product [Acidithrix sp. C25]|nr:unnamed protein product [Acidithrix sp. C25]
MRRAHWNDTVILVWFWQVAPWLKIRKAIVPIWLQGSLFSLVIFI